MKKLILFTFFATSIFGCSDNPTGTVKTGSSINNNLFAIAKEMNKKCPMPIDENSRMDSATVFNENLITYHYTVHSVSNKDVDLIKFKTSMQKSMDEKYKSEPQFAIYRNNNIAIAYDYKDKSGEFLCYFICDQKN